MIIGQRDQALGHSSGVWDQLLCALVQEFAEATVEGHRDQWPKGASKRFVSATSLIEGYSEPADLLCASSVRVMKSAPLPLCFEVGCTPYIWQLYVYNELDDLVLLAIAAKDVVPILASFLISSLPAFRPSLAAEKAFSQALSSSRRRCCPDSCKID